jgi:Ca-activated chloride channel homolog
MKRHYIKTAGLLLCMGLPGMIAAQSGKKLVREGNDLYKKGKYSESETFYRKALEKDPKSYSGSFNLGDALYRQGKLSEAMEQFQSLAGRKADKSSMAKAYHNLGNVLLENKKYEESIEAYKQALKAVPGDADTKYNLAYAQAMLKKQQQQQNKNQQNKEQQNKEQQDQQQQQQNKDQQNKDQQNKEKQDQQQQQDKNEQKNKQQAQPRISKEDAQRMLEALSNQEKDLQKKLGKREAVRVQVEKDW